MVGPNVPNVALTEEVVAELEPPRIAGEAAPRIAGQFHRPGTRPVACVAHCRGGENDGAASGCRAVHSVPRWLLPGLSISGFDVIQEDRPMTEPTPDANQHWTWQQIEEALRDLRFGSVTLMVQDGVVVQVDRTDRRRYQAGRTKPRLPESHPTLHTVPPGTREDLARFSPAFASLTGQPETPDP